MRSITDTLPVRRGSFVIKDNLPYPLPSIGMSVLLAVRDGQCYYPMPFLLLVKPTAIGCLDHPDFLYGTHSVSSSSIFGFIRRINI